MATRGFEQFTAGDAARHNARRGRKAVAAAAPSGTRSKYGAVPTMVDGIRFHSAAEARRYGELKVLERAGEIRQLRLQPAFELTARGKILGKYVADFEYLTRASTSWATVYEDVKGMATPLYKWKKKHVEAQYGIRILEIR